MCCLLSDSIRNWCSLLTEIDWKNCHQKWTWAYRGLVRLNRNCIANFQWPVQWQWWRREWIQHRPQYSRRGTHWRCWGSSHRHSGSWIGSYQLLQLIRRRISWWVRLDLRRVGSRRSCGWVVKITCSFLGFSNWRGRGYKARLLITGPKWENGYVPIVTVGRYGGLSAW